MRISASYLVLFIDLLMCYSLNKNPLGGKGLLSIVEGMKLNKTIMNLYITQFNSVLGRELENLLEFNKAQKSYVEKLTFEDVLKDGKARGPLMRSKLMVRFLTTCLSLCVMIVVF